MRLVATRKTRTAALNEEIHSIHHANKKFWDLGNAHTREDGIEYYRRQDRLEAIRCELTDLTSGKESLRPTRVKREAKCLSSRKLCAT